MTAANGRIEIYGQRGPCDSSEVTVARAMPAILEGRMTNSQWNRFCDDLDTALKPAAKIRKAMLISMIVLPIIFIVMTAITFMTFMVMSNSFIFVIIGAVIMFAGFGILMCVVGKSRNSIETGLRKVCDETSARHSGLSFHVRYESRLWSSGGYVGGGGGYGGNGYYDNGYHDNIHVSTTEYIEVYVADAGNNAIIYDNLEVPIATATATAAQAAPSAPSKASYDPEIALGSGEEQRRSPAERMRELDEMKGLLSDEEYQRKRAEIMSDV